MMPDIRVAGPSTPPMKAASTVPRAVWYPTVGSIELREAAAKESALGFRLLGENLVLWVDAADRPAALADRCAHEGARLSKGICTKQGLICRYHGWAHDSEGKALPPGHRYRRPPPSGWGTVPAYRTTERLGRIWVALEEPPTSHPAWAIAEAGDGPAYYSTVLRVDRSVGSAFDAVCARLRALHVGEEAEIAPFFLSATLRGGVGLALLSATPIDDRATQLWLYAVSSAALHQEALGTVLMI
jgi:nitrite reductase/ring-hydroxylating ferredoxin subunit